MSGDGPWGKRADTIVHGSEPFNSEPCPSALDGHDLTPIDTFYTRNHGAIPDLDAASWRLVVTGLVDRELELGFEELTTRFRSDRVVATLQCAGNRRAGFNAIRHVDGEDPWGPGATSNAAWRGVPLAAVLEAAGVRAGEDLHVEFEGPDVTTLATPAQPYGSSVPLAKALSAEVLLAYEMNDEPLPRVHGGPVRVVVPGYIGARSVKWVTRITVRDSPSDNYFQAVAYHILPADADPHTFDPSAGIPLSSVALNCDVLTPRDGAVLAPGPVTISGYAFAGDDRGVARVDVSIDDGVTWRQADLASQSSPWSWRLWSLTVEAAPGPLAITARAWDGIGAQQPESAAALWNPKGYANNSWARVFAEVADGEP